MEVIGTYDPIPKADPYDASGKLHKDIRLDSVRARYWIGVGAQPSDTAWRILAMVSAPDFAQPDTRYEYPHGRTGAKGKGSGSWGEGAAGIRRVLTWSRSAYSPSDSRTRRLWRLPLAKA